MSYKIGSSKRIFVDPNALLSGNFWRAQDINRIRLVPKLNYSAESRGLGFYVNHLNQPFIAAIRSYVFTFPAEPEPGEGESPLTEIRFAQATLNSDEATFLERYKGYPVRINASTIHFYENGNLLGVASIGYKLWLGGFDTNRQLVYLLNYDGTNAVIPNEAIVNNSDDVVPLTPEVIGTIPEWAIPELSLQDQTPQLLKTYEQGNKPIDGAFGHFSVIQDRSYIITSPGRADNDGVVQDAVQGGVETGQIPLNFSINTELDRNRSSACIVLESYVTSDFVNASTSEILQNGQHLLTVEVSDRHALGLSETPMVLSKDFGFPVRIDDDLFFVERFQETGTESLILDLVRS